MLHFESRRAAAIEAALRAPPGLPPGAADGAASRGGADSSSQGGDAGAAPRLPPWLSGPSIFARHAEFFFPAIVGLLLNPSGGGGCAGGYGSPVPGGPSSQASDEAAASPRKGGRPPGGGGPGGAPACLHYVWRDVALVVLRWDRLYERQGAFGGAGLAVSCGCPVGRALG
jgi:hypothetical protein